MQDVFALSQTFLTALYPPRCAGCDAFCETLFCASCQATLQTAPPLSDLASPREYSLVVPEREATFPLQASAALLFDGALREAIHHFKYEGRTSLAAPLAQLMLETVRAGESKTRALPHHPPVLVPIPLHSWRRWRRGYNQSELLARELGRLLNAQCLSLLRRTRYTVTQTELSHSQRLENVGGAFALNKNAARVLATKKAREIVLLDDVYTTGATLHEAARVMHTAFPTAKISALTLAYRPPS